jgi:hypothetical protein
MAITKINREGARLDLTIERGSTFALNFTFPFNLTGYTVEIDLRTPHTGPSEAFALTVGNGRISVTSGATSTVSATVSATDTKTISFEEAEWDMKLTTSGGVVTRPLYGWVSVKNTVTY